jgi:hypothetical protein
MPASAQTWRGGARIGLMNATWPFAQLKLTPDELVLQVVFLGTYVFRPGQVTRVEPYGLIPFVGKGVRIHHRVSGYPEKIVFWYLCMNPQPIVDRIRELGYGT